MEGLTSLSPYYAYLSELSPAIPLLGGVLRLLSIAAVMNDEHGPPVEWHEDTKHRIQLCGSARIESFCYNQLPYLPILSRAVRG